MFTTCFRKWWLWLAASALGAAAATAALVLVGRRPADSPAEPACPIQLRDATGQTGITWRHTDGSSGKRYIVETISAGLATFDYDGDGLVDIYFVNGAPLQGTAWKGPAPRNTLYRNLGGFRFEDVTEQAGVGDTGYGLGVTVGDYDNDGDPDLFVSNYGPKVLYRNNGDGTFTNVTRQAGVGDGDKVGAGASFLDIESDGDLDLYVANYVDFSYETYKPHIIDGRHIYPSPLVYHGVGDTLFRNNGDGTFTDVTQEAGIIEDGQGTGMGMIAADYDNDGDTDLFILNDVSRNYLYENDGTGKFREVGIEQGVAFDSQGRYLASMGVDCADYDNNGWLDFFQTSYSEQLPALYRNTGRGYFEEVTAQAVPGSSLVPYINWGVNFGDFDNDGILDLFVANGNTQDNLKGYSAIASYEAPNAMLRGTGGGKFVDVSDQCGDGLAPRYSSRGSAADDLDNDGRLDVVVLNARTHPTILRNESPRAGKHWIQIELRGVKSNRDGVGAHVYVTAAGRTQLKEVHSGRGYQSHFGSRLHFGLGHAERVEAIEVRWIGGHVDRFQDLGVDQRVLLVEGRAEPQPADPHQP
jgi:hypothetical protein